MFVNYKMDGNTMVVTPDGCSSYQTPRLPALPSDAKHFKVSFWAYMEGSYVGSLKIFGIQPLDDNNFRLLKEIEGIVFLTADYLRIERRIVFNFFTIETKI